MNGEGYQDRTADRAIRHHTQVYRANPEADRRKVILDALRAVARVGGYELIGRVTLKDRKTGVEYR